MELALLPINYRNCGVRNGELFKIRPGGLEPGKFFPAIKQQQKPWLSGEPERLKPEKILRLGNCKIMLINIFRI
jgi:hypothetical protein